MSSKVRKRPTAKGVVAGTLGALSVIALSAETVSANQTVQVKNGDTVWAIAQQHGVSTSALENANGATIKRLNSSVDLIQAGQQLTVHGGTITASQAPVQSQTASTNATTGSQMSSAVQSQTTGSTTTQQVPAGQPSSVVSSTTSANNAAQQAVAVANTNNQQAQVNAVSYQTTDQAAATFNQSLVQVNTQQGGQVTANTTSQTAATSQAAQNVQSQVTNNQAQTAPQVQSNTQQQTATTNQNNTTAAQNTNLQGGSVVSLATKIANTNSVPYVWGGSSLSGMDCSGLVDYVYANAEGKSLPHNTVALESYVTKKAVSQAQPGDLLFWGNQGATYHTAIYTGNGQFVAAAKPGTNVSTYTISQYFMPSFAGTVK